MSELLEILVKTMDKHHAQQIQVLDFHGVSSSYDYFVIATASNSRLAWAMVDYIEEELKLHGLTVRSIEGNPQSRWILVDCYDVVVHLFVNEEREVYQLDKLWGDLPQVKVEL